MISLAVKSIFIVMYIRVSHNRNIIRAHVIKVEKHVAFLTVFDICILHYPTVHVGRCYSQVFAARFRSRLESRESRYCYFSGRFA